MRRFCSYELTGLLRDELIKTFDAEEIASGRKVFVHLLTSDLGRPDQNALLAEADSLAAEASNRVLDCGCYAGTAYVVTEAIADFMNLREGLAAARRGQLHGSADVASPVADSKRPPAGDPPVPAEMGDVTPLASPAPDGAGRANSVTTGTDPAIAETDSEPGTSASLVDSPSAVPQPEQAAHGPSLPPDTAPAGVDSEVREWLASARAHLENHAFASAAKALENVLRRKPDDQEAVTLIAEVERLEQEMGQVRDEKESLYQSARQHCDDSDLALALAVVDRLAALERRHPDPEGQRTAVYRDFCEQVRSEREEIHRSYQEAQTRLADNDFDRVLAICENCLAKYPHQALFQVLKFDAGEKKRQALLAFIAEVDRRVAAEPDFDRRLSILEEALGRYPSEKTLQEAVRLLREKRELVGSLVTKASYFERRRQFDQAMQQWRLLQSVHPQLPDLAAHIQRVENLLRQQQDGEMKARWVEQIEGWIEVSDLDSALNLVEQALTEQPGDLELQRLQSEARRRSEQAEQAMVLLSQGQQRCSERSHDEGFALLRKAHHLAPRNSLIRTVLVNSLYERARHLVEPEPEAASLLLEEILQLDARHYPAATLRRQLASHQHAEYVTWCLVQADKLKARGDLKGARALLGEALRRFPEEPRLLRLKASLHDPVSPEAPQATVPGSSA